MEIHRVKVCAPELIANQTAFMQITKNNSVKINKKTFYKDGKAI